MTITTTPRLADLTIPVAEYHKARHLARFITRHVSYGHTCPEFLAQIAAVNARPDGTLARVAFTARLAFATMTGRKTTRRGGPQGVDA